MPDSLKIVTLEAENVKRLKAVRITPEGNLVVIGGNNGQGKTSVLDSIMYALGGKGAACDEPVHEGKKKAEIKVDLGDVTVTRTFTAKGSSSLTVKDADGGKISSPQALLDKLTGKLSFDPLAFDRMDAKKQRATLVELTGLDLEEFESKRKGAFDSRTDVNRDLKNARAKRADAPTYPDVPEDAPSATEAVDAYRKAQEDEQEFEHLKANAKANKERRAYIDKTIKELEAERAHLEESFVEMQEKANAIPIHDMDTLKGAIDDTELIVDKVRANKAAAELDNDIENLEAMAEELTERIEKADKAKADALAAAKFPVDGLAFDEDGVTYNDHPFDQASAAERLRVSVAMGLALNPTLRVMLIRDGSLLDDKSLAMLAKLAEDADAQVWLERVGDGKECSVIIDDGEVAEVRS